MEWMNEKWQQMPQTKYFCYTGKSNIGASISELKIGREDLGLFSLLDFLH